MEKLCTFWVNKLSGLSKATEMATHKTTQHLAVMVPVGSSVVSQVL